MKPFWCSYTYHHRLARINGKIFNWGPSTPPVVFTSKKKKTSRPIINIKGTVTIDRRIQHPVIEKRIDYYLSSTSSSSNLSTSLDKI
jgi:hypothetical protein